jgi:HSP20 family protein
MHADSRVREMKRSVLRPIRTPSARHLRMPVEGDHGFSIPGTGRKVVPVANQRKVTMKTHPTFLSCLHFQAILALVAALIVLPPATMATEEHEAFPENIIEKTRQLQDRMSDKFRDTWKELRESVAAKTRSSGSLSSSAVDVREQNDGYTVRVSLPGRDAKNRKVTVDDDRVLKIEAEAEKREEKQEGSMVMERKSHYSQYLTLPGPVDADQLKVDRKDGILVITVPKKK